MLRVRFAPSEILSGVLSASRKSTGQRVSALVVAALVAPAIVSEV